MTDDHGPGRSVGSASRPSRQSHAERRAQRGAVEDPEVVLAAGLRFLEARARSEAEVRRRLADAGYRPDLIEATIGRLTTIGLLDDEMFARHWIESRDRAHPRGEVALKRELRLRGVDLRVIEAALEIRRAVDRDDPFGALADADDEAGGAWRDPDEVAARALLARRRHDLDRVVDPRKRRARAYALLARNGFTPAVASAVSAIVVAGTDDGGTDPADTDAG